MRVAFFFMGHGKSGTITDASVAVILWPIRLQCVAVWFHLASLLCHVYLTLCELNSEVHKIRLTLDFPERYSCVIRGVYVLDQLRKGWATVWTWQQKGNSPTPAVVLAHNLNDFSE
jgi:hypothetical protein